MRALTIQPGNAYAHNNLAANLEVVGRRDEAIAHYRRTLELRPDWSTVRQNLERLEGSPPPP